MESTYVIIFKSGVQVKVSLASYQVSELTSALERPIHKPACVCGFVIDTIAAIILASKIVN